MLETLLTTQLNGPLLALLVIFVAWIWEDAAVIGAALLAVDEKLSVSMALVSIFLGISSGDMALYYLGRFSHRWRWLRARFLLSAKFRVLRKVCRRKVVLNILIIRFIPGLRTIGFTLCGLWRVPVERFLFAMIVAGAIWISIVFSAIYFVGGSNYFVDSPWKWLLVSLALVLLAFNNVYFRYRLQPVNS